MRKVAFPAKTKSARVAMGKGFDRRWRRDRKLKGASSPLVYVCVCVRSLYTPSTLLSSLAIIWPVCVCVAGSRQHHRQEGRNRQAF